MKYAAILLAVFLSGAGIWALVRRLDQAPALHSQNATAEGKPSVTVAEGESAASTNLKPTPLLTGSVEGRVIYEPDAARPWRYGRYYIRDPKDGALAEAVVALNGSTLSQHSPPHDPQTAVMDQKNFQFVPETLAIRTGDRVKFLNGDPVTHNVYSRSPLHPFDITLQGEVQEIAETFDRAGGIRQPVWLGCQFHGSMRAWIYVFDHPWFQVTGPDGRFRLENIPVGDYRLQMVHPAGDLRFSRQIRVESDQTVSVEIRVSPEDRVTSDR